MHDSRIIIPGIILFLALVSYPVWNVWITGPAGKAPRLDLPKEGKLCVLPVKYMKENHMRLLASWRDAVVRDADHSPVAVGGRVYRKSLSGTCLKCHGDKSAFCDRCHGFLGVSPRCWDCHFFPKEKKDGTE